jgi:hypothetical protein
MQPEYRLDIVLKLCKLCIDHVRQQKLQIRARARLRPRPQLASALIQFDLPLVDLGFLDCISGDLLEQAAGAQRQSVEAQRQSACPMSFPVG